MVRGEREPLITLIGTDDTDEEKRREEKIRRNADGGRGKKE
jgi:hypothetical protein